MCPCACVYGHKDKVPLPLGEKLQRLIALNFKSHLHRQESVHTSFHLLCVWVVYVLLSRFLVISWAFCSTGSPGDGEKEDKHGFDVVENSLPSQNKAKERSLKKKKYWKRDAKCNCLLNHVQKKSIITMLFPAVLHTWGIIRLAVLHTNDNKESLTEESNCENTELCNHQDLSSFYSLLSFHNSYFPTVAFPLWD